MKKPLKMLARLRRRRPGWRLRRTGDLARDRREWVAADAAYANYLTLVPDDWAIWVQRGHAKKETGDLAGAERCYRHAVDINPPHADPFFQLAEVARRLGRESDAIDHYRRAAELGEAHAIDVLTLLGVISRDWAGGGDTMLPWVADRALVRTLLDAQAARDLRNWGKAEELYLAYLRDRPNSPQVLAEFQLVHRSLRPVAAGTGSTYPVA